MQHCMQNVDSVLHMFEERYAQLQQMYADLKERKIQGLGSMLEEHTAKLMSLWRDV